MRADYQTYQNAAGVSIKGLLFQLFVALVTAGYAFWSNDHAALTGAMFIGIGVIAWLALAVVFDQHRRERIEAMEVEALSAGGGAGNSVFDAREEFRPAAAKLAGLYKWFFPIVTILVIVLLAVLGAWRLLDARDAMLPGGVRTVLSQQSGWALGLGISFAALGFVVARYAAGLGKQAVWANLRAGASFAVGASLVWLAISIGHLVKFVGPDSLVRAMPVVIPAFMIVIAAELVLQFLLTIYRPRKAGEIPRAAFESRILGFAAAPDRIAQSISEAINYQLGFDVTGGWAYQLLRRSIEPLLVLGVLVVWGMTSIVVIQPHQRAMILRWGNPVSEDVGPGWHFKAPWPIDTVYIPEYFGRDEKGRLRIRDYTATGLRRVELGTAPPATPEPILWTNDHIGDEVWQYVRISDAARVGGLTDIAAVSVEIPMQYTIENVYLFDMLGPPELRDELLRSAARREVTRFFQERTLDEILGGDRSTLSGRLRERVQAALDAMNPGEDGKARGSGVKIAFVGVVGVHPPKEAAPAFETPVQAAQRREAKIAAAETDAVTTLTEVAGDVELARRIVAEIQARNDLDSADRSTATAKAASMAEQDLKIQKLLFSAGGSAAATLARARGQRWTEHMLVRGRAAEYRGKLTLFEAAPELYRVNQYFAAVRDTIKDARVYLVDSGIGQLNPIIDLKEQNLGVDIFNSSNSPN